MKDQTTNDNSSPNVIPPEVVQPEGLQKVMEVAKQIFREIYQKIISNKIIAISLAALFGIMLLIVILGLIFGNKGPKNVSVSPTPTRKPFILSTPESPTGSDIISVSQKRLDSLKTQINDFDAKQTRLSPPAINFDISF
jgi:hypothetical protein